MASHAPPRSRASDDGDDAEANASPRSAEEVEASADHGLVDRLRQSDVDAAKTLYLRYYERLIRFAGSYVSSRDLAEEVVQDTFLALWTNRETVVIRDNARVYLYGAVRNRALTQLAHDRVVSRAEETALREDLTYGMARPTPRPDQQLEADALSHAVARAIASLPEARRTAFVLRWRHELPYDEIARIMQASVTAVTVHVSRARAAIAALIGDYADR